MWKIVLFAAAASDECLSCSFLCRLFLRFTEAFAIIVLDTMPYTKGLLFWQFTMATKIKHPRYNIRMYVLNEFLPAHRSCKTRYF